MIVDEACASCLYEKQKRSTDNGNYLAEIRQIIENRTEKDTPPTLLYRFDQVYERYFGRPVSYREDKKRFNDLVLSMQDAVREKIDTSADPFTTALVYARLGNYIDFGALNEVREEDFIRILEETEVSSRDKEVIAEMKRELETAKTFLLVCDNCGEIVLDRLFLERLEKDYPSVTVYVMVRGGEVLNDATVEDALYVGMDRYAKIISSGVPAAGAIYEMMDDEAKRILDGSDVVLSKGQANYESLSGRGRHIYYSFLCKCDKFMNAFCVKRFAGMLIRG